MRLSIFPPLLASTLLLTSAAYAKPISESELNNVAKNWLYKKHGIDTEVEKTVSSKELLKKAGSTYAGKENAFYFVQLKSKGWVIITADDVASPIIGYAKEGNFDLDNLPPQLTWMLETFAKQIDTYAQKDTQTIPLETALMWETLKQDTKEFKEKNIFSPISAHTRATTWKLEQEVSLNTPTWDQCNFYNAQTPFDTASKCPNDQVPTGCTATAMAEIMRYYSWPSQGVGSHTYTSDYGQLSANFGATTYNWASMPTGVITSTNNAVATIMYHAGVAVEMDYAPKVSRAWFPADVFENHFRYWATGSENGVGMQERSDFSDSNWHSKLKTELRKGHPILYTGFNAPETSGHTFVLEGFDTEGSFYEINFGWNGNSNGVYTLNDITPKTDDYSSHHRALFNLKPNNTTYKDRYEPDNTWDKSSYIVANTTNAGYSINPASDADYTWFWNDTSGTVTIETRNSSGDTVMWLYNYYGQQIAYDDDGGVDNLSKITTNLASGQYYIKVMSYNSGSVIGAYDLRISK